MLSGSFSIVEIHVTRMGNERPNLLNVHSNLLQKLFPQKLISFIFVCFFFCLQSFLSILDLIFLINISSSAEKV